MGVGGGFVGLAGDRPPREVEGKPEPAGRTRQQSVVQCRAREYRSGREHLPIPGLGGGELPGPMLKGGWRNRSARRAATLGRRRAGWRAPGLLSLRGFVLADLRPIGSTCSRPAPSLSRIEWYRIRRFAWLIRRSLSSSGVRRLPNPRSAPGPPGAALNETPAGSAIHASEWAAIEVADPIREGNDMNLEGHGRYEYRSILDRADYSWPAASDSRSTLHSISKRFASDAARAQLSPPPTKRKATASTLGGTMATASVSGASWSCSTNSGSPPKRR